MEKAVNKRAIGIIVVIIFFNVFSKLLGFVRDALIGSKFGAGISSDAYYMGLSITTIIFLSLGSAIATTIIPIIVKVEKDETKDTKVRVLSSIINLVVIISVTIGIIYMAFTPELISLFASGFTGEKLELTIMLTRIMIPTVLFISIAYIYVGMLQAHEHYILPTIISLPYNVLIIGYLFIGMEKYGIKGLAVVTLVGWIAQMLMQVPQILKTVNIGYRLIIDFNNSYVRDFLLGILPIILITATQQINVLSDNQFISRFGDGKVTALYFTSILFTAIVTTVVYGITAVMFPKFNKRFVEIDKTSFYKTITKVIEGIVLLLIPISVGLIIVSKDIVSIIFMRGEFLYSDVLITSSMLIFYSSFMLAFGVWDVLNKAFYTMGNKKMPMIVSVCIIVSNYILNTILIEILGISGIVIGTSISFYLGIFVSFILFNRIGGIIYYKELIITFIKSIIAAIFMAIMVVLTNILLNSIFVVDSNVMRFIVLIIEVLIGLIIYLIVLYISKENNIYEVINNLLNKRKGDKLNG